MKNYEQKIATQSVSQKLNESEQVVRHYRLAFAWNHADSLYTISPRSAHIALNIFNPYPANVENRVS